ncbi:HD domain-containing protein [Collinsella sp. An2]|uniref:HD domain-containing protein n=1 Tax=Collinsella sp. An2 TaxID=1965585 RepID=UPI001EF6DD8F|nr:HD domain-containing protein [Collinsella sp. An2]
MEEHLVTIDRDRALAAFHRYVEPYDMRNPRIALKIDHTLRVAELCERIAREQGFAPAGVDVAWLCGLLHDLGRFEQLRRWDTFRDDASVSHAALGAKILFGDASSREAIAGHGDAPTKDAPAGDSEPAAQAVAMPESAAGTGDSMEDERFAQHCRQAGSIRAFLDDPALDDLIRAAVEHHSDFRLPDDLAVRTRAFCDVVRDADKIDILRVTCTDTVETVLGVTEDELLASEVSPATEDAFFEHRTVKRDERSTPADYLVGLACFAYELTYPASLDIAIEQGFLFQPFERPFGIERPFSQPATRFLINQMDGHLRAWIDEQD